jgi:hypothetical protein
MDSDKLGDKITIGILDLTWVNQASYTITLNKDSEMYRNMSQGDFDKQVKELTGIARSKVALYIDKVIQAFMKDDKFLIKILYFFKFDLYYQFHCNIAFYFELNKITLIVKSALCCLEHIPKHWASDTFGLLGHAK